MIEHVEVKSDAAPVSVHATFSYEMLNRPCLLSKPPSPLSHRHISDDLACSPLMVRLSRPNIVLHCTFTVAQHVRLPGLWLSTLRVPYLASSPGLAPSLPPTCCSSKSLILACAPAVILSL